MIKTPSGEGFLSTRGPFHALPRRIDWGGGEGRSAAGASALRVFALVSGRKLC